MAVKQIKKVAEVDNDPDNAHYGEYDEGTTWENQHIYQLTHSDGSVQHLSIGVIHDSYGRGAGVGTVKLVTPKTKTVEVWE